MMLETGFELPCRRMNVEKGAVVWRLFPNGDANA
jgi:hypothetical protein